MQPGIKPTELDQESEGKVQEEFKTKWHFLMSGNRLQRALGQTGGGRAIWARGLAVRMIRSVAADRYGA